jgi:ABC-type transport system involved in cytochrome c biogenesis permease subunit
MTEIPSAGQLALLICSISFFVLGGALSLSRIRWERSWSRLAAKSCLWTAITLAAGVLVWHAMDRQTWMPLGDNFDALVWLGLLVAGFVMYVQRRRPIGGLDWFLMPMVVLVLLAAAIFGRERPHAYVTGTWSWVHGMTAFGGLAAFFVAGAAGLMYLVANHRLRSKTLSTGPRFGSLGFGSLERLENMTLASVTLGFALLTVTLITGFAIISQRGAATSMGAHWLTSPKVLLTFGIWVVYAVVLHSPINPSFRGKRTAMLSILGFILCLGAVVAVQFMQESR